MPTDQELPPAESQAISKDSSSTVHNLTNEPETQPKPDSISGLSQFEPDTTSQSNTTPSFGGVPLVEHDNSSRSSMNPPNEGVNEPKEDDTGTLKQGDSVSHETKPAENETSEDSGNTTQAAEINKQEPEDSESLKTDASRSSSPPDHDPTQEDGGTTNEGGKNPKEDDTGTLKQGDSASHETKPAENETSEDSGNTTQATEINKQEPEDSESLKTDASRSSSPPDHDPTQEDGGTTNEGVKKPKEDDTGTLKQGDSASHETKPAENETSEDSGNTNQAAEINKQEPKDRENLKTDASRSSSPPDHDPTQEDGGTKIPSQDSDPKAQEIQPAQHESTSQTGVPPEDNVTQTTQARSQELEDTEVLADPSIQDIPPAQDEDIPPAQDESRILPQDNATQFSIQKTEEAASPTDPQPVDTTQIETETIPKDSQARNQETDHISSLEQDVTLSENEAPAGNALPIQSKAATDTPEKDVDSSRKRRSIFKKVLCLSFKRSKQSSAKPIPSGATTSAKPGTSPSSSSKNEDTSSNLKKKETENDALSNLIQADLNAIDKATKGLKQYNDCLIDLNEDAEKEFENNKKNNKELRKSLTKLKLLIPSQSNFNSEVLLKDLRSRLKARESILEETLVKIPQLHKNDIFYYSQEMEDFQLLYQGLEHKLRICLLCFSIFPGNETIRKRLMVRWWAAEGLASEEESNKHFDTLTEKGFIVPVNQNRSLSIGCYRMHPLYHSMLKMLAEKAKFFNFDDKGEPTQNFANTFQACLVGDGLLSYQHLREGVVTIDGLEKIHLVMNVAEPILEFKPLWFSMMRNVNVLYLGRWQASDAAHIEVDKAEFLDELDSMNSIKFLSLQGISNIIKLTKSILALKRLECLDFRACYNLERIPSRIGLLTRLTHLDMSQCYLLDNMPKSLSELKNLRVFKGFVVREENFKNSTCTLADLKGMINLTKLCIYTTSKRFPDQNHVSCLEDLKKLVKLTIAWGGEVLKEEPSEATGDTSESGTVEEGDGYQTPSKPERPKAATPIWPALAWGGKASKLKTEGDTSDASEGIGKTTSKLPSNLEKLDLKCFPSKATPSWLQVANLKNLKKLYIRGGRFFDLGQYRCINDWHTSPCEKGAWKVEVLRLKYLSNLEMEWRQLHELFPDLVYLEQISCPKLTLFNCGAGGVWIDQTKLNSWEKRQTNPEQQQQP